MTTKNRLSTENASEFRKLDLRRTKSIEVPINQFLGDWTLGESDLRRSDISLEVGQRREDFQPLPSGSPFSATWLFASNHVAHEGTAFWQMHGCREALYKADRGRGRSARINGRSGSKARIRLFICRGTHQIMGSAEGSHQPFLRPCRKDGNVRSVLRVRRPNRRINIRLPREVIWHAIGHTNPRHRSIACRRPAM